MSRSRLVTITTTAGLTLGCGGLLDDTTDLIVNPPPPQPAAYLNQQPDGTCMVMHTFECPPPEEATCNPPPPMPEDCPPLARTDQITRLPDGTCQASGTPECPPDWECTSPLLVAVDCPEQLGDAESIAVHYPYGCLRMTGTEQELTADCPESLQRPMAPDYRIEPNDDGTCTAWYTGDMSCPEGASCNPPPPRNVPCPPG